MLKTAIITARNAPAHERVVFTLRSMGIEVDEVFFMGGVEKARLLNILKPHIFFDDQTIHLEHIKDVAGGAHSLWRCKCRECSIRDLTGGFYNVTAQK